jgi:antitoxin CcdA
LVSEARALGINVSRACEEGLETEVRRARAKRWQDDNSEGFEAWNAFVERNGVPLEHKPTAPIRNVFSRRGAM